MNIHSLSFHGDLILVSHDTNKLLQELSFFLLYRIYEHPEKQSAVQTNR